MALEILIQAYDSDDTAEDGTTTTNIEMTGHGLSVGDMVINSTRNSEPPDYTNIASRRVAAVPDANNITVTAITDQAEGDTIKKFIHADKASYLLAKSLRITRRADYKSNCSFTFVTTTSYLPLEGQDIIIKLNK